MNGHHKALAVLTAIAVLAIPAAVLAQTAPPAYRPGLGDLMTTTVQPRHIKLALAGRESNWPYAAYALHELEDSFERAARIWPRWRAMAVGSMIESVTKEPMADLGKAIEAADAGWFAAPYGRPTETCNTCHQSAERGIIVIRTPDASPFPDQDFRPVKR